MLPGVNDPIFAIPDLSASEEARRRALIQQGQIPLAYEAGRFLTMNHPMASVNRQNDLVALGSENWKRLTRGRLFGEAAPQTRCAPWLQQYWAFIDRRMGLLALGDDRAASRSELLRLLEGPTSFTQWLVDSGRRLGFSDSQFTQAIAATFKGIQGWGNVLSPAEPDLRERWNAPAPYVTATHLIVYGGYRVRFRTLPRIPDPASQWVTVLASGNPTSAGLVFNPAIQMVPEYIPLAHGTSGLEASASRLIRHPALYREWLERPLVVSVIPGLQNAVRVVCVTEKVDRDLKRYWLSCQKGFDQRLPLDRDLIQFALDNGGIEPRHHARWKALLDRPQLPHERMERRAVEEVETALVDPPVTVRLSAMWNWKRPNPEREAALEDFDREATQFKQVLNAHFAGDLTAPEIPERLSIQGHSAPSASFSIAESFVL